MAQLDFDRLLRFRLAVARYGEMDLARWWNTKGQLGRVGAAALRRGFPRTYRFAQARAVFAVAAHRVREAFPTPGCVTLWSLPERLEDEFEARWEHWLEHAGEWEPFFSQVENIKEGDLPRTLADFGLVDDAQLEAFKKLRRSPQGPVVQLPNLFDNSDADVALLALGFARGEPGALVVPYARRADA